ncbi:MAG: response regulator [Deltaproteobacteria bacterium]|nr:response regulator [Deltaproteobacteria bacterium]
MSTSTEVTLDNCASEPIHIPGAIQPYGVLFACRGPELIVSQVSANVGAQFTEASPETVLGRSLQELVDEPSAAVLRAVAESDDVRADGPFRLVTRDNVSLDAVATRSGDVLLIEVEPATPTRFHTIGSFDPRLRSIVRRLHAAQSIASLSDIAAAELRRLTGFDRVMVYRFDADWNGEVVAEHKRADLEPFLGQRYPASDIPAQARRLYTVNRLRLIADASYEPCPLVPPLDPQTRAPLDMSESLLRSVSPIHIQYLHNMGVRASMSVSLIVDGELAGLIACHHYAGPHRVSVTVRDTCEYLGAALSWQLHVIEGAENARRMRETQRHEGELVRRLAVASELLDALDAPALLELVGAKGAAVVLHEGTRRIGQCPSLEDVQAIVAQLRTQPDEVHVTDRLAHVITGAERFEDRAAGMLAVAIAPTVGEYILWFRPAIAREIRWAGNPSKQASMDEAGVPRLTPRGSFELYKEVVRGRCEPWQEWQIEAASSLRRVLLGGVRRRAVELRNVNERLRLADRAKDHIVAAVSHELRSPLNVIAGWASLLKTGGVPPERVPQAIEVIVRNATLQAQLIDDLLDVSRVTTGNLTLEVQDVDLATLIETTVAPLAIALEAKSLKMTVLVAEDARAGRGDPTRLRQVVTNLVSNAIKFTDKGGAIEVRLDRRQSELELVVSDSGRGISEDFLPHVFEAFRQEDMTVTRRAGGLGLGLAIVKTLVELHGGRVWVESEGLGRGARFFVRLPVAVLQQRTDPAVTEETSFTSSTPAPDLAGRSILVVEDEHDAREMIRGILSASGAVVTVAPDARTALAVLSSASFDLLVSDIGMPDVDGLTFVRTLRARPTEQGGATPAVALTAYARAEDRIAALQAGFAAHVAKPVHADELLATLASVLRHQR